MLPESSFTGLYQSGSVWKDSKALAYEGRPMYFPEVVSRCHAGSKDCSAYFSSFLSNCCWSGKGLVALVVQAVVAAGDSLPSSSSTKNSDLGSNLDIKIQVRTGKQALPLLLRESQ